MTAAFDVTEKGIRRKLREVLARIEEARRAGEPVGLSWLLQEERYTALLTQAEAARAEFTAAATPTLTAAKNGAAALSTTTAEKLSYLSAGVKTAKQAAAVGIVFNRLPEEQLRAAVAAASDGSPLSALFESLGRDRSRRVREVLVAGIGRNAPSREIAKELRAEAQLSRQRAATIARTELHRAARTASLRSYAQNPRIVEGWIWRCACDARSCRACWAMHGTRHPHGEEFGSHPSCRCYPLPALADLRTSPDEKDVRPTVKSGAEVFASRPESLQRKVLGRSLYAKYAAGEISLGDAVHTRYDARWGLTRTAATRAQAAQNAARRTTPTLPL